MPLTIKSTGEISSSLFTVDSDGDVINAGELQPTTALSADYLNVGQLGGRRNLIINGAMQVAQRGTSSTDSGYATVDRFRTAQTAVDELVLTQEQVTDAPTGFANSWKVTVSTPETSVDANEVLTLQHRMEGQNLQHLKKGTSDAESVTLSFWVKGSVTGTYIVNVNDDDNGRMIAKSYTINSADTWEYKTLTFAGDTTGSLDNDSNQSMTLRFFLGAGTDYTSGTLATDWATATTADRAVGQTNIITTSGATFQITGVQLEVGSVATPFEHRSFGEELAMCERYFQKSYNYASPLGSTNDVGCVMGRLNDAVLHRGDLGARFSTRMRSDPTVTGYSLNGTVDNVSDCGTSYSHNANVSITAIRKMGQTGWAVVSVGTSTNDIVGLHYTAEAEL
jgi:hypothetical protein